MHNLDFNIHRWISAGAQATHRRLHCNYFDVVRLIRLECVAMPHYCPAAAAIVAVKCYCCFCPHLHPTLVPTLAPIIRFGDIIILIVCNRWNDSISLCDDLHPQLRPPSMEEVHKLDGTPSDELLCGKLNRSWNTA